MNLVVIWLGVMVVLEAVAIWWLWHGMVLVAECLRDLDERIGGSDEAPR